MSSWYREVPTEGAVELPPDPRALNALGRNHRLETALADLVDNSVDAGATRVLIRFVQDHNRLVGLYVVDNGTGIRPDEIDTAMTVGGRRSYGADDLGTFGLGLKAASFSQAEGLTVLSRASDSKAVGRRWLLDGERRSFLCDKVPTDFAAVELDREWLFPLHGSGTVVRWDRVRAFPSLDDRGDVDEYLDRTISALRGHLGLMFHRILANGRISIQVDVEDEDGPGLPTTVTGIDPFGYRGSPDGWPKDLLARAGDVNLVLHCHIWPRRSNTPEYRLVGGAHQHQGLYFYRRDRLLQAGGWQGIHAADKKLQLGRVAVNMDTDNERLFMMNPEKSQVLTTPEFAHMVNQARAEDGTTIANYLHAAEQAWTVSNQRSTAKRKAVFPPGRGLHPKVTQKIVDELPQQSHERPLNILWRSFRGGEDFFEVDRENGTLWLNQAYRRAMMGGRHGGLNDLPVVKALLFLLVEEVFQGVHLGARDKDNIALWQEILTAAAMAEQSAYESRT
jgi:DNA mismatch repair enzyme (predicted ATPase)